MMMMMMIFVAFSGLMMNVGQSMNSTIVTTQEASTTRCYAIRISTLTYGGSTDNIYMYIKGSTGITTDIMDLGSMAYGDTEYDFYRCGLTDVGTISYAYLYNFGSDDCIIDEVTIDDNTVEEYFGDYLGYDGDYQGTGCDALEVDFTNSQMTNEYEEPTCSIDIVTTPSPDSNLYTTRCYDIKISTLTLGGSDEYIYIKFIGYNGIESNLTRLAPMTDGDTDYYYTRCNLIDVGTVRYAKIYNFGTDDVIIDEVTIDTYYTVEEYWGDTLGYDGDYQGTACAVLTVDFYYYEMYAVYEEPYCSVDQIDSGKISFKNHNYYYFLFSLLCFFVF